MRDTSRQLHFTHSLEQFYLRLGELLSNARTHQSRFPPELLDEIAYTTGELTIVLRNHSGNQEEELVKEVLSLAQALRQRLRSDQLKDEEIILAFGLFSQKIDLLLTESKQAA